MSDKLILKMTSPKTQKELVAKVGNACYSFLIAVSSQQIGESEIEISNESLMEILNIKSLSAFNTARKKCIDNGVLNYRSNNKSPGFYKVNLS